MPLTEEFLAPATATTGPVVLDQDGDSAYVVAGLWHSLTRDQAPGGNVSLLHFRGDNSLWTLHGQRPLADFVPWLRMGHPDGAVIVPFHVGDTYGLPVDTDRFLISTRHAARVCTVSPDGIEVPNWAPYPAVSFAVEQPAVERRGAWSRLERVGVSNRFILTWGSARWAHDPNVIPHGSGPDLQVIRRLLTVGPAGVTVNSVTTQGLALNEEVNHLVALRDNVFVAITTLLYNETVTNTYLHVPDYTVDLAIRIATLDHLTLRLGPPLVFHTNYEQSASGNYGWANLLYGYTEGMVMFAWPDPSATFHWLHGVNAAGDQVRLGPGLQVPLQHGVPLRAELIVEWPGHPRKWGVARLTTATNWENREIDFGDLTAPPAIGDGVPPATSVPRRGLLRSDDPERRYILSQASQWRAVRNRDPDPPPPPQAIVIGNARLVGRRQRFRPR